MILEHTTDATYEEAVLGIWCVVEINLGITCGCAMRLRSLLRMYLPKLGFYASSRSRSFGNSPHGIWSKSNRNDEETAQAQSYRLHSIQKSSSGPDAHVTTFDGYRDRQIGLRRDNDSTDQIL